MDRFFELLSFFGGPSGPIIIGTITAAMIVVWDWRVALVGLFTVQVGVVSAAVAMGQPGRHGNGLGPARPAAFHQRRRCPPRPTAAGPAALPRERRPGNASCRSSPRSTSMARVVAPRPACNRAGRGELPGRRFLRAAARRRSPAVSPRPSRAAAGRAPGRRPRRGTWPPFPCRGRPGC